MDMALEHSSNWILWEFNDNVGHVRHKKILLNRGPHVVFMV